MVTLTYRLPEEVCLVLIPYSCSTKLFLNSRPRNSPPQSYVISIGRVYHTNHVVSTKFAVIIAFLFLYCFIPKHPIMGSIIVTAFKIKLSPPFLHILLGPMISTHSLPHVIYSASLAGNWPYAFVDRFICWHTSHSVTSFRKALLMSGQFKCCQIIASVIYHPGWRRYMWYHFTMYCWSCCGMTIILFYMLWGLHYYGLCKKKPFLYSAHVSFFR